MLPWQQNHRTVCDFTKKKKNTFSKQFSYFQQRCVLTIHTNLRQPRFDLPMLKTKRIFYSKFTLPLQWQLSSSQLPYINIAFEKDSISLQQR